MSEIGSSQSLIAYSIKNPFSFPLHNEDHINNLTPNIYKPFRIASGIFFNEYFKQGVK